MRVALLLHEHGRSGGVEAIYGHARRLVLGHGVDAEVVLTNPAAREPPPAEGLRVRTLDEARADDWDVAVATWWETATALFELRAPRRAVLLQNIEHRYYHDNEEGDRLGARAVLALPVDFIVVAGWMSDLLAELRPGARTRLVRYGIDKAVFAPRKRRERAGALRVLVDGQPSVWWKGVQDAVFAVRRMSEPHELTVVALDPDHATGLDADRVVGGLDADGMAALYAESDVLVKLARFEGFGLAPLEAFHLGVPCVVTPYTGHEEYVRHGENGVVAGFDDPDGVAHWLDLLARDRDLLERVSAGALATAAGWTNPEQSTATLAGALTELSEQPAPSSDVAFAGLLHDIRLSAELARDGGAADAAELARAHSLIEEISYRYEAGKAELEGLTSTRAYRAALAARRVLDVVRR